MLTYPTNVVAQGVPIAIASAISDAPSSEPLPGANVKAARAAATALKAQDCTWADGLSATVARSVETHPLRVCILDNSGSMRSGDGKFLMANGTTFKSIGCSRWRELSEDVSQIAQMSVALGARTDFHLLNPAPGMESCSVCADAWSGIRPPSKTLDAPSLQRALASVNPNGSTPLTEAVLKVVSMVQPQAPRLRANGQAVAVLICTDGLPDNKASFVQAMQLLQALPVWCVVRLVTDDDSVVDYWNDLDRALEAPLEVLDDVRGEAAEVYQINPWLTYAPPLHLARLFGLPDKLFDALDEEPMAPSQIAAFLRLLLGVADLPEPELDEPAFLERVRLALHEQPPCYDPKSGRMKPWVDLRLLERALHRSRHCGKGGGGCALM